MSFVALLVTILFWGLAPDRHSSVGVAGFYLCTSLLALAAIGQLVRIVVWLRPSSRGQAAARGSILRPVAMLLLLTVGQAAITVASAPNGELRAFGDRIYRLVTFPFPDAALGSFKAEGEDIGTWTMKVDRCVSGQREDFFGVVIFSSDDERLGIKVVQPPIGTAQIAANAPGTDHADVFDEESCKILRVDLQKGSSTFNDIRNVYGTVVIDCENDRGHISGEATLNFCH